MSSFETAFLGSRGRLRSLDARGCTDFLPDLDSLCPLSGTDTGTGGATWNVFLLLNSGLCKGLMGCSGIDGCAGTGGNALCNLAKFNSSLTSALPTEKIVCKVSLLELCLKPTFPEYVFGKQATGNASTRCSRCRRASADGGGMRNSSLGERKACTVNTGSGFGGCID